MLQINFKDKSGMYISFISMIFGLILTSSCARKNTPEVPAVGSLKNMDTMQTRINIIVNSKTFSALLSDNASALTFSEMLPMTIVMTELNGNEKYFDLPQKLPVDPFHSGVIQAGDLMLYGSNTLVLFYKSFSTSYPYTLLGRIENPDGIAEALGTHSINVTIRKY